MEAFALHDSRKAQFAEESVLSAHDVFATIEAQTRSHNEDLYYVSRPGRLLV